MFEHTFGFILIWAHVRCDSESIHLHPRTHNFFSRIKTPSL